MQSVPSLTFRSEKSFSLLCKKKPFPLHLNPRLAPPSQLSLSLSLSCTPSRSQGAAAAARHQHAAAHSREHSPQPRAARAGGGPQPRGRRTGPRVGLVRGGIPCWPEKRRNPDLGVVLQGKIKALILILVPKNSQFPEAKIG